jgi:transcriptional regulator with XRE-family HTH domain
MLGVSDAEVDRLRNLLRAMVEDSGRSFRDIERSLGLGHGYLSHLFNGRLELKFKHVFLLAEELGFNPSDFFLHAYALPGREPARPSRDDRGFRRSGELRPPYPPAPGDRDTMRELVRELMAEALLYQERRDQPARSAEHDEETPPGRARRAS